ncbi:unnamed protein product [Lactuca saligna]|uniref:Uncharacterized protein n=1 Tax=Lactuca saligna TaxID=75948 RepID=A0AA35YNQ0_LACSI|nr:unnamed protein product [Lactuca saligna]
MDLDTLSNNTHEESTHDLPRIQKDGFVIEQSPLDPYGTHSQVNWNNPISFVQAQSVSPATDSKLTETKVVPPTSEATTGLIPTLEILPTINSSKTKPSVDVPTPDIIVGDHPQNNDDNAKEVPFSTPIADDPKPDDEEDHSEEIIFEDHNTTVGSIQLPSIFNLLRKSFSSKAYFDFGP